MYAKRLKKSDVEKILVISLSNLGDVILTFPVMDILKENFPLAKLSVIVGPKALALVNDNPAIVRAYTFDKYGSISYKLRWILNLRKEKFDLAVDLRNTAIPFLIGSKYRTSFFVAGPKGLHRKSKHLKQLKTVYDFPQEADHSYVFSVPKDISDSADRMIQAKLGAEKRFVVINAGAADEKKRWAPDGFAGLADEITGRYQVKVIFVGDQADEKTTNAVIKKMKNPCINLCGQTTLIQLAALLKRCCLVVANDSAVMHLASYLDRPIVALFGPTDPGTYGPWSAQSFAVRKNENCPACERPKKNDQHTCMAQITLDDIVHVIEIHSLLK
ncbi:MAG: glycosyltransferase family 9 protein [Candidatus Omnitrophota bacterium]